MDQDGVWHGGRPQPRRLCIRWGPSPLPEKGGWGGAPYAIFGPFLFWPNGWMHQDATWCGGRPQPRGICVRWGPSPLPKRGRSPQFSAYVYCGQTAAWIKMPLGTEVGLGPGDIVVDGDPAPPHQKGVGAPFSIPDFRPHLTQCRLARGIPPYQVAS